LRPREQKRAQQLDAALTTFDANVRRLPALKDKQKRFVLLEQLVESSRRVDFVKRITGRDISPSRADPASELFDPVRAAAWHLKQGNTDEACWLVFLSVHFGKNRRTGWALPQAVYGGLGGGVWDWPKVSGDPKGFRKWLAANQMTLKGKGNFGNHRKYQSLDARKPAGTGAAVEGYVKWVDPPRSHHDLFAAAHAAVGANRRDMFDWLYGSMGAVVSFGRTARFDYLTMIGKLGLAPIEPGSTYMTGATGPRTGATMLFGKNPSTAVLDRWLVDLADHLGVSMQVVEDALCNWQKDPKQFVGFRG
jgi:hypothetical protein